MSTSADWYFGQADLFRGRADACRELAEQLEVLPCSPSTRTPAKPPGGGRWPSSSTSSSPSTAPGWTTPSTGCGRTPAGLDTDADDYDRAGASILDT